MEKYIFDKNNGLWYELQGDYFIPCLVLERLQGIQRSSSPDHSKRRKTSGYYDG